MLLLTWLCKIPPRLLTLLIILATIVICQWQFSWIGFNPTDDGYHLAGARRIIDGQVPHRDFITIRPAGSFYLHTPIVWLGGEHMLLTSRLVVWLQLIAMTWAWIYIIDHYLQIGIWKKSEHVLVAGAWSIIGLVFSVHSFPLMAWHTIDGLTFASIGLALLLTNNHRLKTVGYLLIGTAPLFKQNFLGIPPLIWLLTGQWRTRKTFTASLLMAVPLVLYVASLFTIGAGPALKTQLATHTDLSMRSYLQLSNWIKFTGVGVVLGFCLHQKKNFWRAIGLVIVIGLAFYIRSSFEATVTFLYSYSYYLFHIVLGLGLFSFFTHRQKSGLWQVAALALGFAWVASISIGYASPALATGALIIILLAVTYQHIKANGYHYMYYGFALLALTIVCSESLIWMRTRGVYRDLPAKQLTYDLGTVFAGATGVRSNQYTYTWLADLQKTIQLVGSRPYTIAPDFPAYWMSSNQPNPLSIDWPQSTELATEALQNQIREDLVRLRQKGGVVIVQKDDTSRLSNGFKPLPDNQFFIVEYLKTNWQLETETDHFIVYR